MARWFVTVEKTITDVLRATVTVEADTLDAAELIALGRAPELDFDTGHSERVETTAKAQLAHICTGDDCSNSLTGGQCFR